jgi:uncharacterized RDD family membrane protein YckC
MPLTTRLPDGHTFGPYRIGRLLGVGGMGAVYQATQLEDGREVALKVLAHEVEGAAFQARFAREGRLAASLSHPNVVYVFGADTIEGHPAIAMELVAGGTLEERVEREGPLPVAEALRCIQQVIDGLEAAHARGILHRDVKPANCYVSADGVVKIGDFGLARPKASDDLQLTQAGMFLGTPAFASPEQLLGDPVDVRSDIFSVGASLHFLLTGKPRYSVDSATRLIAMVMRGAAEDLEPLPPTAPAGLQAVLHRCIARDPAARFQDYEGLREALREFQPAPQLHAPLARRLVAGVFDFVVLMLLDIPVTMLANVALGHAVGASSQAPLDLAVSMAASVALAVAYFAVPEARFGTSAGKWLLRLRVEGARAGHPPTAAAAGLRALWFMLPFPILHGIGLALGGAPESGRMLIVPLAAQLAALFLPRGRRGNGWLAEHDRWSGTRVVRVMGRARRETFSAAVSAVVTARWDGAPRIGPFDVRGTIDAAARVALGHDPALDRPVWIVLQPAGAAPVPASDRQAMRPGHLRWIAGQRTDTGGWDAYAALRGSPLTSRLQQHATWSTLRGWLTDLAEEVVARESATSAGAPGTAHREAIAPARVWIADDGRAVLLPFALPAEPEPLAATGGALQAVVDATLAAEADRGGHLRWPARALRTLETLRTATPRAALPLLEADAGEPAVLTTQRRLVAWGIPVAFTMLPAFLIGMSAWTEVLSVHPDTRALLPVLMHVEHRLNEGGLTTREDTLAATYVGMRLPAAQARAVRAAPGSLEHDLLVNDSAQAAPLVALASGASPDQHTAAVALVEGQWKGQPPDVPRMSLAGVFILAVLLLVAAAGSIGSAVTAKRAPLLAMLGLAVVDRQGRRAGRLRLLARQLATWGPGVITALLITGGSASGMASRAMLGGALLLVLCVAALLVLLRTPHRGIADRLAGTVVVPD